MRSWSLSSAASVGGRNQLDSSSSSAAAAASSVSASAASTSSKALGDSSTLTSLQSNRELFKDLHKSQSMTRWKTSSSSSISLTQSTTGQSRPDQNHNRSQSLSLSRATTLEDNQLLELTNEFLTTPWENPSYLVKDLDTGESFNVEEIDQHYSLITLDAVVAQHTKQTSDANDPTALSSSEHTGAAGASKRSTFGAKASRDNGPSASSLLLSLYTSDETAEIEFVEEDDEDDSDDLSRTRSANLNMVNESALRNNNNNNQDQASEKLILEPRTCLFQGCQQMHHRPSGYCEIHEVIAKEEEDSRVQALYLIPLGARAELVRMCGHGFVYDSARRLYTVYVLEMKCSASNASWLIYRRYQEFKALNDCLRPKGVRVPVLPPKKLLGSFEPDFIAKRQAELFKWLQSLLDFDRTDDSALNPHLLEEVRRFLTSKADKPPALMMERLPFRRSRFFGATFSDEDDDNNHRGSHCSSCCHQSELARGTSSGNGASSNGTTTTGSVGETDSNRDPSGLTNSSRVCTCSCHRQGGKHARQVTLDDFRMIQVIGRGSFGKVVLVGHKETKKLFAMKILSKENIVKRKQVEHTRTERRVLGYTRHPFIVGLHYAFQTPQRLYFVLDYCPGGELFYHLNRMKKLPEHMACFYAAEITLALEHLHGLGVVYRDLKPENILLTKDGHIKLADFGLAKEGIRDGVNGTNSLCGTPEYLPPEILNRMGHGTAVDWWNLGMVLYEMLTGLPPWYTNDRKKLFERLRSARLHFPPYVSRRAEALIRQLLNRNPAERLGARGAYQVKNHLFFEMIDWDRLLRKEIPPPFRPCHTAMNDGEAPLNFEPEFTRLPLPSAELPVANANDNSINANGTGNGASGGGVGGGVASFFLGSSTGKSTTTNANAAYQRMCRSDSDTFQGFTYENPSFLESLACEESPAS